MERTLLKVFTLRGQELGKDTHVKGLRLFCVPGVPFLLHMNGLRPVRQVSTLPSHCGNLLREAVLSMLSQSSQSARA